MDKADARRLLDLPYAFTDKELKAAYAAMVKRHHPEDEPEEFLKIQEAYLILSREALSSPSAIGRTDTDVSGSTAEAPEASAAPAKDERPERKGIEGLDEAGFERAIHEAEEKKAWYEAVIDQALRELDRDDAFLRAWVIRGVMDTLTREQLEDPRFQAGLLKRMKASRLKTRVLPNKSIQNLGCRPSVMDAIIERYGFRRVRPGTLPPQAEELRAYLDKTRGLDARRSEWVKTLISVFLITAGTLIFPLSEGYSGSSLLISLISGLAFSCLYAFIYLYFGRDMVPGAGAFLAIMGTMFLWTGLLMGGISGAAKSEMILAPIMGVGFWMTFYPLLSFFRWLSRKRKPGKKRRKG